MTEITEALADLTTLFGVLVVLAILVVGFFKGRQWLSKACGDDWEDRWHAEESQRTIDAVNDYISKREKPGHVSREF